MSDRFLPIGKYNPPTSGNTYQVPSQHITHEPGNLEFYEVLTRNQAVQTQVKSAQPAQQSIVQPSRGTSSYQLQPAADHSITPAEPIKVYNESDIDPEVLELLKNAPSTPPQGDALYQTMLQNSLEYNQMKTQQESQSSPVSPLYAQPHHEPAASDFPYHSSNNTVQQNPAPYIFTQNSSLPQNAVSEVAPSYSALQFSESQSYAQQSQTMQPNQLNPNLQPFDYDQMRSSFHSSLFQGVNPYQPQPAPMPQQQSYPVQSQNPPVTPNPLDQSQRTIDQYENMKTTGAIKPAPKVTASGPTESFFSFFKNVGSALTLGFYRPDGEPAPEGTDRVMYPFKKLLIDAPKSLLLDTPVGIARSLGEESEMGGVTEEKPRFGSRRYAGSKTWLSRGIHIPTQHIEQRVAHSEKHFPHSGSASGKGII